MEKRYDVVTEADVNSTRKICREIKTIRDTLIELEDSLQDIEELRSNAITDSEREIYDFMVEEKKQECKVHRNRLSEIIKCVLEVRHPDAHRVLTQYLLDEVPLRETTDKDGIPYGVERAKYYKRIGMRELASIMKAFTLIG